MADSPEKSIGDLLGSGGISQLLQNPVKKPGRRGTICATS